MLRNRFLIALSGCLLAASAAWADDVGYVECSSHPDGMQVFAKPRKSPEVVASVACGERFTILVYGFVFSRVQTSDGKIGYVYSNMIAVDRAAAPVQKPASPQMVTASEKVPVRTEPATHPAPPPSRPQSAPAQPVAASASITIAPQPTSPAPASPASAAPLVPEVIISTTQPTPARASTTAPAAAPASGSLLPTPPVPETTVTPVPAQPAATPDPAPVSSATASSAAASNVSESTPPAAQPDPSAAQPQPTPAIRPVETRGTWERPLPGGRTTTPRIEVFGGYSFARMDGGAGSSTNLNGAMGSFGWNFKSWLQVVGDSSYNFVTINGIKTVLYGNHFGPRYFYRRHNRFGVTPFVEGLIGGSRADVTVTGTGGYTTSNNCMSYKVGGGLDLHPSRHWEIRLFDFDYYRTSFGTNVHQNNYSASAGIVLRLFGGAE